MNKFDFYRLFKLFVRDSLEFSFSYIVSNLIYDILNDLNMNFLFLSVYTSGVIKRITYT